MRHLIIKLIRILVIFQIVLFCLDVTLSAQSDSTSNMKQFLFPDFSTGVARMKTGGNISAKMNYNMLTERMTFYQNGKMMDLAKPQDVDTILLMDKKFAYIDGAFYEVLLNAPIALFIQHKSDLVSAGRIGAYGTTSQTLPPTSVRKLYTEDNTYNMKLPEEFKVTPSPINWVRIDNEIYKFFTERQFLKLFPAIENELKQFINQSKISMKDPDDLIKLVEYCNELTR